MKTRYALILLLLLTACHGARKEALEAWLSSEVGQHIDEVILDEGPPSSSHMAEDGRTVYEWVRTAQRRVGDRVTRQTPDGISYTERTNVTTVEYTCRIRFITDSDGVITNWNYRGRCY